MEFKLYEFEMYEVNGMSHIRFKITTPDDMMEIKHDDALSFKNEEDIEIMKNIQKFVEAKTNTI